MNPLSPYLELFALSLAMQALWLRLLGADPAAVMRAAADVLEEK